jgi:hypothetical protein
MKNPPLRALSAAMPVCLILNIISARTEKDLLAESTVVNRLYTKENKGSGEVRQAKAPALPMNVEAYLPTTNTVNESGSMGACGARPPPFLAGSGGAV